MKIKYYLFFIFLFAVFALVCTTTTGENTVGDTFIYDSYSEYENNLEVAFKENIYDDNTLRTYENIFIIGYQKLDSYLDGNSIHISVKNPSGEYENISGNKPQIFFTYIPEELGEYNITMYIEDELIEFYNYTITEEIYYNNAESNKHIMYTDEDNITIYYYLTNESKINYVSYGGTEYVLYNNVGLDSEIYDFEDSNQIGHWSLKKWDDTSRIKTNQYSNSGDYAINGGNPTCGVFDVSEKDYLIVDFWVRIEDYYKTHSGTTLTLNGRGWGGTWITNWKSLKTWDLNDFESWENKYYHLRYVIEDENRDWWDGHSFDDFNDLAVRFTPSNNHIWIDDISIFVSKVVPSGRGEITIEKNDFSDFYDVNDHYHFEFVSDTESDNIFTNIIVDVPPSDFELHSPTVLDLYVPHEFSFEARDKDGDWVKYIIDWGDGTTTTTSWSPSSVGIPITHTYSEEGIYEILVEVVDNTESEWFPSDDFPFFLDSTLFKRRIKVGDNQAPNVPSKPSGNTILMVDTEYTFTTAVDDLDNDNVSALFNWGTGFTETNLNLSGSTFSATYSWSEPGTYTIKCKGKDEWGWTSRWQSESEGLTVTVIGVPSKPTNLEAIPFIDKIELSWLGVLGTEYYEISWREESWPTEEFITNTTTNIFWEHSKTLNGSNWENLDLNENYTYYVRAVNDAGESSYSNPVTIQPSFTPPQWTQGLSFLPQFSLPNLKIDWVSPNLFSNLDRYEIYQKTILDDEWTKVAETNNTQEFFYDLENYENYRWKVKAVDVNNKTSFSEEVETTIDGIPPTQPSLSSLIFENGKFKLSWTESSDSISGISRYEIRYDDSSFFTSPMTKTDTDTESIIDIGEYDKTYFFQVRAVDNVGLTSEWSSTLFEEFDSATEDFYSYIDEIWFDVDRIVSGTPFNVRVKAFDDYNVTEVKILETETILTYSGSKNTFTGSLSLTGTGKEYIDVQMTNENNSRSTFSIPVYLVSESNDTKPKIQLLENDKFVTSVVFSEKDLDVTSYRKNFMYHVKIGNDPKEKIEIDLTELEPLFKAGKWWIFDIDWLDSYCLDCTVHGVSGEMIEYKVPKYKSLEMTIEGFNNLVAKILGWIFGTDFELIADESEYMSLVSQNNVITVEYSD